MALSKATDIVNTLQFQVNQELIGKLTGLSKSQTGRVLRGLSGKIETLNQANLLKNGEQIFFQIKDANGKIIPKNKSGISSFYSFEYMPPRTSRHFNATINKRPAAEPVKELSLVIPDMDPQISSKRAELKRLSEYFDLLTLDKFVIYDLRKIAKTIDYYLHSLKIKLISNKDASLDLGWLIKAFEQEWYKTMPITSTDKIREFVFDINDLHRKMVKVIEKKEIATTLQLLPDKKPAHEYKDFSSAQALRIALIKKIEELPADQKANFDNIVNISYKELQPKCFNGADKQFIQTQLAVSLINKHFNFV